MSYSDVQGEEGMIDQILTILGVMNNYYLIALIIAGGVITLFLFEFLYFFSRLFHKLGGF